jgi:Lar family restriction alleviation protein
MPDQNATRAAGSSAPACSPCPFCGETDVKPIYTTPGSPARAVVCSMCNAQGPWDARASEAVRLWNQRANAALKGADEGGVP